MGDVTASSRREAGRVRDWLAGVVATINDTQADDIRSPLTVTLGDEFQGVVASAEAAMRIVFALDALCLEADPPIDLHYVILEGGIETPINPDIAHGMLGPGLTRARQLLTEKPTQKRRRTRCTIELGDVTLTAAAADILLALEGLRARWNDVERPYAAVLLEEPDDSVAADRLDRDRTSVYRRRRTLLVEEYRALQSALLTILDRGLASPSEEG
ncbi:SatD family protein [Maricaulis virginensis]|uniref:SatD family (SatD) n=1 Tax=Maricaulis virginensis TaxID=144022 RepID=A0A9W6ILQ5_9PROT|nr:SatD family protein [Maricaulis virginensis]GLK52608.1 hypothetical protein GCM10017621_21160 [Maricaulis virginensis]